MARWIPWLLLLPALLVSLALNAVLWQQAVGYYTDIQGLRLSPLEEGKVRSRDLRPATEGSRLWVFFGDSRSAQWPAPPLEGFEVRNLGIGGQTSVQVAERMADQLLPLKPDTVLLQVGINDLKAIAMLPADRDAIVAETKRRIDQIVDALRAQGAKVILTTIFPRGALDLQRRPFWSSDVDAAVQEVNRHIRGRVGPGVSLFDTEAVLRGDDGLIQPAFARDLLHLRPAGYDALNEALLRHLAAPPAR